MPPPDLPPPPRGPEARRGFLAALAAFGSWGVVPLYWKQLPLVPAAEITAHRVIWSTVLLAGLLTWQRRWGELRPLRDGRQLGWSVLSSLAIGINWGLFIWAVMAGRVLESSLGYFMNPLMNVLVGALFFRERLRRWQWVAVALAAAGVLNLTVMAGALPWVSLALCASFGLYGALRKLSRLDSVPGLFVEAALLSPLALAFLVGVQLEGGAGYLGDPATVALLMGGGAVTALPLLWFSIAARNLPLSTLGMVQYLSPTTTFLLGIFVFREPFTSAQLVAFALIWAGLVVFSLDLRRHQQHRRSAPGRAARPEAA